MLFLRPPIYDKMQDTIIIVTFVQPGTFEINARNEMVFFIKISILVQSGPVKTEALS